MTAWAYADPPYLGKCAAYGHRHDDGCWDDIATHAALIDRLGAFDGWALSLSSSSLRQILPLTPAASRVLAWCKPWAASRPRVAPVYAWEPVILYGAPSRCWRSVRHVPPDWCRLSPTMGQRVLGAKPEGFAHWLFDCMGVKPGDTFADLFPGSGAMGRAFDRWQSQLRAFG